MSLECYTSDFGNRHEITHAISIQTADYYNDIGKIILNVPIDDYNISVLEVGGMLYNTVTGFTYVIVNIKTDTINNRLTVNGYTTDWLLNSRVIASKATITNVESGIYSLLANNLRSLSYIVPASAAGLAKTTNVELYGGQLLDEVLDILEDAEYGHKMVWDDDTKKFTFTIYDGNDLTTGIHAIVFSDEQGTAKDLVINDDDSLFKNVCYCATEYSDETELVAVVGTATGDSRREIWINASGVTQEEDESKEDFFLRVQQYAAMQLGRYIHKQSFTVTIDASEFGVLYNLGDIVMCNSMRFGVQFAARITGIKYKMDINGTQTDVVLGDPILTKIGEIQLNGRN